MQGSARDLFSLTLKYLVFRCPLLKPWCDGNSILVFLHEEKLIITIEK